MYLWTAFFYLQLYNADYLRVACCEVTPETLFKPFIWRNSNIGAISRFHSLSFMVETRRSKPNIVSVMKHEDLTAKINSSKITSETKELLKLFVAMFATLQLERDNKIKNIDKKVVDLDKKIKRCRTK